MSILRRVLHVLRAKQGTRKQAPDSLETIAQAHRQQIDLLEKARRSAADLAAGLRRLEILSEEASTELANTSRQAEEAVVQGKDDDARAALQNGIMIRKRLDNLNQLRAGMEEQSQELYGNLQRLEFTVERDSLRYQSVKAKHTAAQASRSMNQAVGASGRVAAETEVAAREAERRARQLQAEAAAHQELSWSNPDSRQVEDAFDELAANATAARELAELKARTDSGQPPRAQ